jgi:hypothetical protein
MSFFSKRKVDQPQTATVNATQAVESDFTERFKAWFSAVERAQAELDADALTPDILSRVGAIPVPQADAGLLNRTQQVYIWSYARSFTERMLENKTIEASAAVCRLKESGADATRGRRAADYWTSVAAQVAQSLA